MTETKVTAIDNIEPNLLNLHDRKNIISYLSFLEKFYEQSMDKSRQERLFRINKAINSIQKYSNCKVSSFNVKRRSVNIPNISNTKIPTNQANIDKVLQLIEKELKENGISRDDIINSNASTMQKSVENDSSSGKNCQNEDTLCKNNVNQKRLSKLFLKIEVKLKTFLQTNKEQSEKENEKEKNGKDINDDKLKSMNKSPSKLPNVMDSFFSNKGKVDTILSKVRKQRRKSLMDFNVKYGNFSKDDVNKKYITDSHIDNDQKRKKLVPCSAQVVIRKKNKNESKEGKISNFCDMIDEKEEDREDMEEIKGFDKIIEEENENIPENNLTEKMSSLNINKDTSVKITSSLNDNKSAFKFMDAHSQNDQKKDEYCPKNYEFRKQSSVFNVEENEKKDDEYSHDLLDDEMFVKSSEKKDSASSDSEESLENEESSDEEDAVDGSDKGYNMLKMINDSKSRQEGNDSVNKDNKIVSPYEKISSNVKKARLSHQREIDRANNINFFTLNSILSPLKEIK